MKEETVAIFAGRPLLVLGHFSYFLSFGNNSVRFYEYAIFIQRGREYMNITFWVFIIKVCKMEGLLI